MADQRSLLASAPDRLLAPHRRVATTYGAWQHPQTAKHEGRFAGVHDLIVTATTSAAAEYVFQLAVTVESALVCLEIYRRDGAWRLRAAGQGYADGLAGLARDFGVDTASSAARHTRTISSPRKQPLPAHAAIGLQNATAKVGGRQPVPRPFDHRATRSGRHTRPRVQLPRTAPKCVQLR